MRKHTLELLPRDLEGIFFIVDIVVFRILLIRWHPANSGSALTHAQQRRPISNITPGRKYPFINCEILSIA
jgi:hypothetical protein